MENIFLWSRRGLILKSLMFVVFGLMIGVNTAFAADSINSAEFLDTDVDGTVDSIDITLDEATTSCTYEAGDWTINTAGSINITSISGLSCLGSVITLSITADANITGGLTAPVISYTDQGTAGDISLVSGDMTDKALVPVSDEAASVILYISSSTDGLFGPGDYIDVDVYFSEDVTIPGDLALNLDNGVTIHKTALSSSSFTYDYTVGATGSGETYIDLTVASFTGTVFDVVGNNTDHPAIPVGNNLGDINDIDVDTTAPDVNNANIRIDDSLCTGTSGECIIGDTIAFEWDNSAGGDSNTDVTNLNQVSFDLSDFGLGVAENPTSNVGDIFAYTLMISAGNFDGDFEFFAMVTDDAGNISGNNNSSNRALFDNEAPELTLGGFGINTDCTGTCIAGDTITLKWYPLADGNTDVTDFNKVYFDVSEFGGGASVTSDGYNAIDDYFYLDYLVLPGSVVGNIDGSAGFGAEAYDDAGNYTSLDPVGITVSLDNEAPVPSEECIYVAGATGTNGAFKFLDTAVPTWNNDGCDSYGDIASVSFDASGFRAVDSDIPGVGSGDEYTGTLTGPLDSQDDGLANNITVTVTDDAGNVSTVTDSDVLAPGDTDFDYIIDSIVPSFTALNPVVAYLNDGSPSTVETNNWYYYDPTTTLNDLLRMGISNIAEADGNFLDSVQVCLRSLKEDDPDMLCSSADFDIPGNSHLASTTSNTYSFVIFDMNGITWPNTVDGFVLNIKLVDDAGNEILSTNASEVFNAILNVDPKLMDSSLDNLGTTSWQDISDFSNIAAGDLVFNAQNLGVDVARMTFNDTINLTDSATIQGLAAFGANVTTSNGVLRVDSDALAALDIDTELMVKMPTAVQPGFVVKDNDGVVIGSIPNDAGALDSYSFGAFGSHGTASNFVWVPGTQTLTFDVTGFSEYDSDNTAPTVTYSPLNSATGVATSQNIVLTFNEAMDTSTFAYTVSPNPGGLAVVWSAGNTVATISHTAFANSTIYTASITTATDLAGNSLAIPSSASFTTVASSGGGGGGGGSSFIIGATSSGGTSPLSITSPITGNRTLTRSIDLSNTMMTNETIDGKDFVTADLTSDSGSITLENDDMSVFVGTGTQVKAEKGWNGIIAPPTIVSIETVINNGKLNVTDGTDVPEGQIEFVLKIGSDNSQLWFDPAITVEIPINLPEGSEVSIYISNDGANFETLTKAIVKDGKLVFETSHFSYFAFASTLANADSIFPDMADHWAKSYVEKLFNANIVNGKADGNFDPNAFMTRAELTKIALLGYEYPVESTVSLAPFADVSVGAWYAPFVAKAKSVSIVNGYANNMFKPNDNVTRAEALKVLAKAAGLDPTLTGGVSNFTDVGVDAWYYDYVRMSVGMGVVNGYSDNTFKPNAKITRAEASKILVKFMEIQ